MEFLLAAAVSALFIAGLQSRGSDDVQREAEQANAVGLQVSERHRWVGQHDGIPVLALVGRSPGDPWNARATLRFPTPAGFSLGPRATGRDAQSLRRAALPLLDAFAARGFDVHLGRTVVVRRTHLAPMTAWQQREERLSGLRCLTQVVRALEEEHDTLTRRGFDRVVRAPRQESDGVHGHVDGVPVRILGPEVVDRHWRLEIQASLPTPLPPGTRVKAGRGGGLGDLILDHALHSVSSDLGAVAARLGREHVRAPLLEILVGQPGSVLRSDKVAYVVSDGALDVSAALDRVLELVLALRGP